MHTLYLVGYDITEPKRQALIRKLARNYSASGQLSAYECWLTTAQADALKQQFITTLSPEDAGCIVKLYGCYWQQNPNPLALHTTRHATEDNFLYIG